MSKEGFFSKTESLKAMHFIAIVLVCFFVIIQVYQTFQVNVQLKKDLISSEQYERLVRDFISTASGLVTIVVMYFFGRQVGKSEVKKSNISCSDCGQEISDNPI